MSPSTMKKQNNKIQWWVLPAPHQSENWETVLGADLARVSEH